ncbi:MAG: hypothetical protein H7645_10740 [Candidatus Heimdallarchaeota archaeon]|nr:hypothetical protein [Candidatus Heimdallarchaeota archaeon]MCK4770803.1 hypothetical protein [Candidatus Heimdallarchaeota archaeon]
MSSIGSEDVELADEPIWKQIMEKIKPFLTREDIMNMDLDSFSALIKRLQAIDALTEQELSYAKKNRDLILIRMGLLHNIPDLSEEDLELGLEQLAVRLATFYFSNKQVSSLDEAEKMVLEMIRQGFSSGVTISLNPEEEILKLREKLNYYTKITLENAPQIASLLTKTKDSLMNIGISGSVFYSIDKFCQTLKKTLEEDLPTKAEIMEATYEWQTKILK